MILPFIKEMNGATYYGFPLFVYGGWTYMTYGVAPYHYSIDTTTYKSKKLPPVTPQHDHRNFAPSVPFRVGRFVNYC